MNNEKVFNELVERLAQSAYYYGVHKNEPWKKALINDKQTLITFINKQQNKIDCYEDLALDHHYQTILDEME